jgi:hypothetical protein
MLQRELRERFNVRGQHSIVKEHDRADALCRHRRESGLEFGRSARRELQQFQFERLSGLLQYWKDRLVVGRICRVQ